MNRILPLLIAVFGLVVPFSAAAEMAPLKGAGQHATPDWFKQSFLDLREDAAEAGRAGKHLFVFFGQEGCPYCAALINTNFSQKPIADYARTHFDSIEINIWGDREVTDFSGQVVREKEFASRNKVWFTPTVLIFDRDGKQVLRINGYYPPHQFMAALRYVGERRYGDTNFAQYLAEASPPPAAGRLHGEPFFRPSPHDLSKLTGKPLAVFFEQKDCAGCDTLHADVFRQAATLEQLARYHVIQLDRWSDAPLVTLQGEKTTARRWADRLAVAYLPSAVLFDDTREVIRIEALLKAFHVQSVLDYVASGAYRSQPDLQRFIRARADELRERGVTVDLWE